MLALKTSLRVSVTPALFNQTSLLCKFTWKFAISRIGDFFFVVPADFSWTVILLPVSVASYNKNCYVFGAIRVLRSSLLLINYTNALKVFFCLIFKTVQLYHDIGRVLRIEIARGKKCCRSWHISNNPLLLIEPCIHFKATMSLCNRVIAPDRQSDGRGDNEITCTLRKT